MQRRPDRLVEEIFGGRKGRPGQVPSLFKQEPPVRKGTPRPGWRPKPRLPKRVVGREFPLGLDLGTSTVRWVQLAEVEGRIHMTDVGMLSVGGEAAPLPELGQPNPLQPALQEMVRRSRVSHRVSLSLAAEEVSVQFLKMPILPEDQMRDALRLQVEQLLPLEASAQDLSVDYTVLEEEVNRMESRLLVVALPRQKVLERIAPVQAVGLSPVALDIDPFAVTACVVWTGQLPPTQTALLLHLGERSASFSVVSGGQLVFTRSVLAAGRQLTQAVADRLQVPMDRAEALKRAHGVLAAASQGQGEPPQGGEESLGVAQALAAPLENLMVDMLHSFKSFSFQMTQSKIQRFDRLLLSGGGALLPGIAPWFQARVGVPVEPVRPFGRMPLLPPLTLEESWSSGEAGFALAMGLALREVGT